jgi:hypothetical protein
MPFSLWCNSVISLKRTGMDCVPAAGVEPVAGAPQPLHRVKDVDVEVNVEVNVTPKKGKVRACEVKVAGA